MKPVLLTGKPHFLYSSMLELLDNNEPVMSIDIREHKRKDFETHSIFKRIPMIEGFSVEEKIAQQIHDLAKDKNRVLFILDSMHTHDHVLKELEFYSPLVAKGSYLIVFDTAIEEMPEDFFHDRPWSKGNNPKTAVWEFLKTNDQFVVDKEIENKLLITITPEGYLKRLK